MIWLFIITQKKVDIYTNCKIRSLVLQQDMVVFYRYPIETEAVVYVLSVKCSHPTIFLGFRTWELGACRSCLLWKKWMDKNNLLFHSQKVLKIAEAAARSPVAAEEFRVLRKS